LFVCCWVVEALWWFVWLLKGENRCEKRNIRFFF
jgi:hypothetical protein